MAEKVGRWSFEVFKAESNVGLVLIHEVYGFDDYIRSVGRQLAEKGVSVAAVDLYEGRFAKSLEEGRSFRDSLKNEDIVDAVKKGVELLHERTGSDAKVGAMGFCMGGGLALMGACNLGLPFCVDYYGMMQKVEEVQGIKGPVLLILASEDPRVTPWAFQSFLPAASAHKKRVEVQLYPNARHGFHHPDWEGYNVGAAKDAWARTIAFLSSVS